MWTEKDTHIERIPPDDEFWAANAKLFFQRSILPELIGKFYSRQTSLLSTNLPEEPISSSSGTCSSLTCQTDKDIAGNNNVYCYCQGPEEGEMLGCDNPACVYKWFHLSCLKMSTPPKSKYWYCPDCRKIPGIQRKERKIA